MDRDSSQRRAFIDAAVEDPDLARRMLGEDQDLLEGRGELDETPLHFLSVEGYIDGVRFLLESGANVDPRNVCRNTPLMECARLGRKDVVELLLTFGADPNAVNQEGRSALHFAAEEGRGDILSMLVSAGGDASLADDYGDTPESISRASRPPFFQA